jgi:hypothetical protein
VLTGEKPKGIQNMKYSQLSRSIIAGIALGAGLAGGAHAVNLSQRGVGEVLVYPYYTVNAGNQTLVSVVNKTERGKAVKVRFREGRNARDVINFHLYLSPFDVWTASLFSLTDAGSDNPANLMTNDNSCTVPRIKGNPSLPQLANGNRYVPFFNYAYTGANNDAGPDSRDRTREGFFEMIEMGEIVNRERTSLTAITHGANGVPANCLQVERAWLPAIAAGPEVTYWTINPLADMEAPQGGLFGTASIVDALAGTMMSYDADAIDAFSDIVQHTAPDQPTPSLASAHSSSETAVAQVFANGGLVNSTYTLAQAVDAVSAVFVQDAIFNEFVTSASVGGASEWVVTFPTKQFYADQAIVGAAAIAPFTRVFPTQAFGENSDVAPVDVRMKSYNREERFAAENDFCLVNPNDPVCIPIGVTPPPAPPVPFFHDGRLNWSSNVMTFNQHNAASTESAILGAHLVANVDESSFAGISDGWANLSFYQATETEGSLIHTQRMRPDLAGGRWRGLPVAGFWVAQYTNGQLTPGVLSNYSAAVSHRGSNSYQTSGQ